MTELRGSAGETRTGRVFFFQGTAMGPAGTLYVKKREMMTCVFRAHNFNGEVNGAKNSHSRQSIFK